MSNTVLNSVYSSNITVLPVISLSFTFVYSTETHQGGSSQPSDYDHRLWKSKQTSDPSFGLPSFAWLCEEHRTVAQNKKQGQVQ